VYKLVYNTGQGAGVHGSCPLIVRCAAALSGSGGEGSQSADVA
jgi:hypothetical protein